MNFSFSFAGSIWNTVAVPEKDQIIVEIRDDSKRQVTFSALDYKSRTLVWENLKMSERWWVNVLAAEGNVLLLQQFHGNENPDKKTLVAIDMTSHAELWRKDQFSFQSLQKGMVNGTWANPEAKPMVLDATTGDEIKEEKIIVEEENEIYQAIRPFQYLENTPYFNTVREFVAERFERTIVGAAEYMEEDGFIFISYNTKNEEGLANYLLVVATDGEVALHEKLGERLKGLGADTFFLLAGCLFYIRNKNELLSYTLT